MATNFNDDLKALLDDLNTNDLRICSTLVSAYGDAMNGYSISEYILIESPANNDETYKKYDSSRNEFFRKLKSLSEEEKNKFFKLVIEYQNFIGVNYK